MKIAVCQMKNEGSVETNLEKSLNYIREASEKGADLILFPEVQLTEFFPQYPGRDVSEYELTPESQTVQRFREACRKYRIMAVPNLYLRMNGHCYDASMLIGSDGSILGIQKMVHVAYAEQFYETDYYTPSDEGFRVFETEFGTIGIVVCFDRHYPESMRTEALMGADLILIPTVNTKREPMKMFEMEIAVQAFQNSVLTVMANRVGIEGDMEFAGESIVVSPNGEILAKAGDQEELLICEADPGESRRIRENRPYTSLRRPEYYL